MSKAGKGAGKDKPASAPDKLAKAGAKANVELSETKLRKLLAGRPAIISRNRPDGTVSMTRISKGAGA